MNIKERIAEIDAFGRELANAINAKIEAEELRGQSPATIRRVEELISIEQFKTGEPEPSEIDPVAFEFAVMKGGIAAAPLVTVARYTGRVGIAGMAGQ